MRFKIEIISSMKESCWYFVNEKSEVNFSWSISPNAIIIVTAVSNRENEWEIKLRLGLGAPNGVTLYDLNLRGF